MKINFTHSLELESRRLLHIAGSLTKHWFQKHSFLVLPQVLPKVPTSQVIFPDLPYSSIPRFWQQVNRLTLATPQPAPDNLLSSTQKLLTPHYTPQLYNRHLIKLEKQWKSIEKQFWHNLFTLFPTYSNRINSLTIVSSQYGPYTTFNLARTDNSDVTIYVRQDSTLDRLLWSILTVLFRPKMQDELHYTWEEIEALVDWLMHESSLALGLKLTHPTIKNLRAEQIAHYRQQSDTYLASLGFSASTLTLPPIPNLTPQEQKLLDLFRAKRGLTASYEEIANVLWPANPDWSLYAITKAVERLRSQIKNAGINTPVILAHRKIGYSLI